MIFVRSKPSREYRNYSDYRPLLREDFRHRCAYCLTHEYFLGGEAGCTIDHHRPIRGAQAHPELVTVYTNLYWCCRECNENKSDTWPSQHEYHLGARFLDPCQPEDDHSIHWSVLPDGILEPNTTSGEYTIEHLKLWRPQLQHHRALLLKCEIELVRIQELMDTRQLSADRRATLESRLSELASWLSPPVFDRPRT